MQTIVIGKLVLTVAPAPGEVTIKTKAQTKHWSVSDFKNDGNWTFERVTDSTTIPAEGRRRMVEIEEAGIEVEWIVAHEITPKPIEWPEFTSEDWDEIGKIVLVALGIMAIVALLPLLILVPVFAAACSSGDPAILAGVKNAKGEMVWLNCFRWSTPFSG